MAKNNAKFKAGEKNVVDLAASIFKGEVILKQQAPNLQQK